MNELNLMERMKSELSEERYLHTIGVMEAASDLALKNGADVKKARVAALMHDCARELPLYDLLYKAHKYKVAIDEVSIWETVLIHGPLGAKIAEHEYCVKDHEILDAIDCHTTGKKNMTKLDKVIYISDYIEPYRDFERVSELRRMALEDLDEAVKFALNFTISDLINTGRFIHPRTLEARNHMMVSLRANTELGDGCPKAHLAANIDKTTSIDIMKIKKCCFEYYSNIEKPLKAWGEIIDKHLY